MGLEIVSLNPHLKPLIFLNHGLPHTHPDKGTAHQVITKLKVLSKKSVVTKI